MNLGVIVLYAPRKYACEITEEIVGLYLKVVKGLELKMEYTLYSIITIMIDAYFDDEIEYRRLIDMMEKNTSKETKQRFESHECTIESLEYAREDLEYVREDLEKTNKDLEKTNKDLEIANSKIADLESEVQMLTEKLNAK